MNNSVLETGDYIKTISKEFSNGPWKGKIRRPSDMGNDMYLIEWKYCGGIPTDICTWVFGSDIVLTRKASKKKGA